MKYKKILIKYNAYISQPWKYKNFTAVKMQDFIFSRERNRKIGTTFFYFLNMV